MSSENMPKSEPQQDISKDSPVSSETGDVACAGWFRVVLPVAVIAACAELGTAILNNSTLPFYFVKGLGISPAIYVLMMIPFFISEALFKSPLGVLADRFGRKPLMTAGALVTVITPLILISLKYQADAPNAFLVLLGFSMLRLLDGLGGAALWPALFAYVGDRVHESKRGAAMGLLNVVYMLGLALGFWIGGKADDVFGPVFTRESTLGHQIYLARTEVSNYFLGIIAHFTHHKYNLPNVSTASSLADLNKPGHFYPSIYLASILFALATLVSVIGIKKRDKCINEHGHEEHEAISWKSFVECARTVPQYIGLAFVTFLGIGNIAPIIKLLATDEFHLTEPQFGVLTLRTALIVAALAYPLGHLADWWGKARSVRLGFVMCAVGLWGIPLLLFNHAVREIGFVISAAVVALGFVIAFPAWNALLTTLSDERKRGTVIGAVSAGQGAGVLFGFISGGAFYTEHHVNLLGQTFTVGNHATPFFLAALLVSIGAAGSFIAVRERSEAK